MLLLLPPIIFESGFNMQKNAFFRNFGTIMMYSFLGTFIAIFTTSFIFYGMVKLDMMPSFSFRECFAFGSLISATDPVSVLATFKELDANANLYAIVFGESIFNDAITIVMYRTIVDLGAAKDEDVGAEIVQAVGSFFLIFIGSFLIGTLSALFLCFILKRQASNHEDKDLDTKEIHLKKLNQESRLQNEVATMVMCPYISYLIAEGLELSGIVAILCNGVVLSQYATPNLRNQTQNMLKFLYETVAYVAESLVFLFLGMGLFAFDHPFEKISWKFVLGTFINLNFARFLNIFIVTSIVNVTRKENKFNWKGKFVMWISGLRGAMAYALAMEAAIDFDNGTIILSMSLLYAMFTILIQASILNPILDKCDVKNTGDNVKMEIATGQGCFNNLKRRIMEFDANYFSPLFVKAGRLRR